MGMNSFFNRSFSTKAPAVILLVLPYLFAHYHELHRSDFYSILNFFLLLSGITAVHMLISSLYSLEKKKYKILSLSVYLLLLFLFYISDFINHARQMEAWLLGGTVFRLRWMGFGIFISLFSVLFFLFYRYPLTIKVQSAFWGMLSILGLVNLLSTPVPSIQQIRFDNSYYSIPPDSTSNKPVYLIILDEYSSPNELFALTNDSSLFDLSKNLKNKGWITVPDFETHNGFTDYSLSSLFNFNLSEKQNYDSLFSRQLFSEKFKQAALYDSLQHKQVMVKNWGIFPLGATNPLTRVYYYPESFFEEFTSFTILSLLSSLTNDFNPFDINWRFYPSYNHNKKVLRSLEQTQLSNKTFVYAHLFMPHGPFYHGEEFEFSWVNTPNYIRFWKFTNKKIRPAIEKLSQGNSKVIITSDHGYRSDRRIDQTKGFAAFYGFDSTSVKSVKSVQDLGSLINAQFVE